LVFSTELEAFSLSARFLSAIRQSSAETARITTGLASGISRRWPVVAWLPSRVGRPSLIWRSAGIRHSRKLLLTLGLGDR
jgi:hypothetical protein